MDTFCVLPFAHLNIHPNGQASVCCVSNAPLLDEQGQAYNIRTHELKAIWKSSALQGVRDQMMRGEQPKQCRGCYAMEAKGIESRRELENFAFLKPAQGARDGIGAYFAEREDTDDLRQSRDDLVRYKGRPWNVDLRFDNICNLKCVICGGHSSSRIEADPVHMAWTGEQQIERQPNRFGNVEKWIKSDALLEELIEFGSDVRYLLLAGGEPFRSRLAIDWMAHLGSTGHAKNVVLRIFTNLQRFNEDIVQLLMPFKKIHLILSIDATADTYEYVRFPGKWAVIEKNAARLAQEQTDRLHHANGGIRLSVSRFLRARAAQASAFSCSPFSVSGNRSKNTMSTGWSSIASNSIVWCRRASRLNGVFSPAMRACGSATPFPTPVEPSSSRFVSLMVTSSWSSPAPAAA